MLLIQTHGLSSPDQFDKAWPRQGCKTQSCFGIRGVVEREFLQIIVPFFGALRIGSAQGAPLVFRGACMAFPPKSLLLEILHSQN